MLGFGLGHVRKLAEAEVAGAREVEGVAVTLMQVDGRAGLLRTLGLYMPTGVARYWAAIQGREGHITCLE